MRTEDAGRPSWRPAPGGLADQLRLLDDNGVQALAYYQALKKARRLKDVLMAEYRCSDGCLLLHLFQTPAGTAFYAPRYRLSPGVNAESSNESGRAANTEDGERKWKAHANLVSAAANFPLNCDHVLNHVIDMPALSNTPGNPVRKQIP